MKSLRCNPRLYNFVLYNILDINTIYVYNYHSSILPGEQKPSSYINDDKYTAFTLEEVKIYNKLTTKLTNNVIAEAIMTASL